MKQAMVPRVPKRHAEDIAPITIPASGELSQSGKRGHRALLKLRKRADFLRKHIAERLSEGLAVDFRRAELDALEWLIASVILLEQELGKSGSKRVILLPRWEDVRYVHAEIPSSLPRSGELGTSRLWCLEDRAAYLRERAENVNARFADRVKEELSAIEKLSRHIINLETHMSSSIPD